MSIGSTKDLEGLRKFGRIVALALQAMTRLIRVGVTTRQLDDACEDVLFAHGARATPRREYGFPGSACISVNDEVVHGVPRNRELLVGGCSYRR